ncbi:MAG: hypothetical protein ACRDG3_01475, partial [Tepidiformaceae bacterium]
TTTLESMSDAYECARMTDGRALHAFWFGTQPGPAVVDPNAWPAILDKILSDVGVSPDEAQSAKMSISGIFGSANASGATVEQMVSRVRQRLATNSRCEKILEHPLLTEFLFARATSIRQRRAQRYGN